LKQREALLPIMQLSAMEAEGTELQSADELPDMQTARREMKQLLSAAIAALPCAERAVYELRDLEEVSGEEAAVRLGITLAAMKSRLHRAREGVRRYMDAALASDKTATAE
jgi:RNA polymerase sigma-70 factor (ECF subfamily)